MVLYQIVQVNVGKGSHTPVILKDQQIPWINEFAKLSDRLVSFDHPLIFTSAVDAIDVTLLLNKHSADQPVGGDAKRYSYRPVELVPAILAATQ